MKTKVKLNVSGKSVNIKGLPDNVVLAIIETFKRIENDPYAILATYSYIFCGLTVSKIKDLIILSDKYGVRVSSREFVRQKIISTFNLIQKVYIEEHGNSFVSPLYSSKNLDEDTMSKLNDQYSELFETGEYINGEENKSEDSKVTEDQLSILENRKEKETKETTGTTPVRPISSGQGANNNNSNRPRVSSSWLVRIRNLFK